MKSRQVLLASRPTSTPTASNFRLVDVDVSEPAAGEILVRNLFMSVDLYMREALSGVRRRGRRVAQGGKMKYQETVVEGLDQAVTAFLGLFSGDNTGKMLVRLAQGYGPIRFVAAGWTLLLALAL